MRPTDAGEPPFRTSAPVGESASGSATGGDPGVDFGIGHEQTSSERRTLLARLKRSAYVDVFLGLALIVTAVLDATEAATAFEEWLGIEVGAHHGLLLLGLLQVVRGLGDLFAGLRSLAR